MVLQGFQARKIAFNLGLSGEAFKNCVKFVTNLYNAYIRVSTAPCSRSTRSSKQRMIRSLPWTARWTWMRMPWCVMRILLARDITEEDPTEVEAGKYNLNFVKLDGNVGCMVNGAGLAMATMDMIKLSGGEPANFLDIGWYRQCTNREAGFKIILKDPAVKAIPHQHLLVVSFVCDRVAQGVIDAYKNIRNITVPIIVRLQGTTLLKPRSWLMKGPESTICHLAQSSSRPGESRSLTGVWRLAERLTHLLCNYPKNTFENIDPGDEPGLFIIHYAENCQPRPPQAVITLSHERAAWIPGNVYNLTGSKYTHPVCSDTEYKNSEMAVCHSLSVGFLHKYVCGHYLTDSYLDNALCHSALSWFHQWLVQSLQSYHHPVDRGGPVLY